MLATPPQETQLTLIETATAIAKPLDENPVAVYLSRLAASSQKTMQKRLKMVVELVAPGCKPEHFLWENLRYQHVAAIRRLLTEEEYSPATVNNTLAAIRGVLKECWRLRYINSDEYQQAIDVKDIKFDQLPAGRVLDQAEFRALWETIANDRTVNGLRDLALLAIARAGLRRSEMVNVHVEHFSSDGTLKVAKGKGRKDRTTYVAKTAIPALQEWLDFRESTPGPILLPVTNQQKILYRYQSSKRNDQQLRGLTDQAVWDILSKRGTQANIADFSPHDLRRTFITELLEAGTDVVTVQRLAGHSDPKTTSLYDRRGESAKRDAVQLLFVPVSE
jgi:site-specific recombinase XerD